MRTKTLLLTAAVGAASLLGVYAQGTNVYSVNVVGYVTKTVYPGFNLIANPLNTTNNTLTALINPTTAPGLPDQAAVYRLENGAYLPTVTWYGAPDNVWDPIPDVNLNPGKAFFILNPTTTAFTITWVGEVMQGTLDNPMNTNGFSMVASMVPQTTNVTALGVSPSDQDALYVHRNNGTTAGYDPTYTYYGAPDNLWDPGDPVGPSVDIGSGFLYFSTSPNTRFTRTFNVQ